MTKRIKVIVAKDCKRCRALKQKFASFIEKNKLDVEVQELMFDTDEAVDLAVTFGLDQVPSFVVRGKPFNKDDFTEEEMLKLFKKK